MSFPNRVKTTFPKNLIKVAIKFLEWGHSQTSMMKPISRGKHSEKISLKAVKKEKVKINQGQSSTTCNSVYRGSEKKSIKDLITLSKPRTVDAQRFTNTQYEDIKCLAIKAQRLPSVLFCGSRKRQQEQGCSCTPKCLWTDHWLSLSLGMSRFSPVGQITKQTDQQIRKDISRTQPQCPQFQRIHYQQALYQCLSTYAGIDQQIGYVQGMNIICSVLVYHGNSVEQCVQILQHLMFGCKFRQVLLNGFDQVHQLSNTLQQCLKYKCHDIYVHMVEERFISLTPFMVGWIVSLLGSVVPLSQMHLVLTVYMKQGWIGIIKIIVTLFLYLQDQILSAEEQTEVMQILSTHNLRGEGIKWEEIIRSSQNIKNLPFDQY